MLRKVPHEIVASILAATTASRIVAVDVREEALQLAREIGAHHTVRSNEGGHFDAHGRQLSSR